MFHGYGNTQLSTKENLQVMGSHFIPFMTEILVQKLFFISSSWISPILGSADKIWKLFLMK